MDYLRLCLVANFAIIKWPSVETNCIMLGHISACKCLVTVALTAVLFDMQMFWLREVTFLSRAATLEGAWQFIESGIFFFTMQQKSGQCSSGDKLEGATDEYEWPKAVSSGGGLHVGLWLLRVETLGLTLRRTSLCQYRLAFRCCLCCYRWSSAFFFNQSTEALFVCR